MIVKLVSEKYEKDLWFKNVTEIYNGKNRWKVNLTNNRHRWIDREYKVKKVLPNNHYLSESVEFYEE